MYRSLSILLILLLFLPFANPPYASACSPAPWSLEIISKPSTALLYGTVTGLSVDRRTATVEVIRYIGHKDAPRVVHLPPTVSSNEGIEQPWSCNDFSNKFEQGRSYVIFLSGEGDQLALLHPQWMTSLRVEDDLSVIVDMHGRSMSIDKVLQQYAEEHQLPIAEPTSRSSVWDPNHVTSKQANYEWWIWSGASLIVLACGVVVLRSQLRRRNL